MFGFWIASEEPDIHLFTDASYYQWGAVVNSRIFQGSFSDDELSLSMPSKETLAIERGIDCCLQELPGKTCIQVHSGCGFLYGQERLDVL